ncbi:MAG: HD domain-containing protein, partial [Clostridia bacterium]|nr:HD domain-containing protein [Clostridia bacterium]
MDIVPQLYQQLCDSLRADGRAYDFDKIEKAFEFAKCHHGDQRRTSGEPYICHPLQVAIITQELGLDCDSVIAALLHDTIEDTEATFDTIKEQFGRSVAELVDGV